MARIINLILAFMVVAPAPIAVSDPADSTPPVHRIIGADTTTEQAILAAIGRFGEAGLELPPLRIHVHPTDEGCNGHNGLFGGDGTTTRIDICFPGAITHELAHAWEAHAVTVATRTAFLGHAGLDSWFDGGDLWKHRGIEQAANLIAWGLRDEPLTETQAAAAARKLTGYQLLTGRFSPRYPYPIPALPAVDDSAWAAGYATLIQLAAAATTSDR